MTVLGVAPASGGVPNILTVEKVIVGDAPDGDFEVEVDCIGTTTQLFTLMFASDGTTSGGEIVVFGGTTCVVTETDDLGADEVSLACVVTANPQSQTFCDGDDTAIFEDTNEGRITITVTNTFLEPEPEPESESEPAAAVVEASPSFTG